MRLLAYPAAAIIAASLLVVWKATYATFCPALLIPIAIAAILTLGLRESSMHHRVCKAKCYFQPDSFFYRWLHGRIYVTLHALLIAVTLAISLCLSVLTWNSDTLWLLGIDGLLICLSYPVMLRYGVSKLGIRTGMDRTICKRWLVALHAPLLILAMVKIQLDSPPPAYLDQSSMSASVSAASAAAMSSCPVIDLPTRLQAEKEAVLWWLMLRGGEYLGPGTSLNWIAWLGFLLSGALGAWAYARLCLQLADFARGGWNMQ